MNKSGAEGSSIKEWISEIRAIAGKEFMSEGRSPHALLTGALFSLVSVVAVSVAAYNLHMTGTLAAGLLWVIYVLSAVIALPRTMLQEEESGTGDLLRMTARPHAVFWGKWLFNTVQNAVLAVCLTFLFILFNGIEITSFGLLAASLFGGCIALSGTITVTGALAARASNRFTLSTAIAVPLGLPVAFWGVGSMRGAFGEGFPTAARLAAAGLFAFGIAISVIGPYLYAVVWKS